MFQEEGDFCVKFRKSICHIAYIYDIGPYSLYMIQGFFEAQCCRNWMIVNFGKFLIFFLLFYDELSDSPDLQWKRIRKCQKMKYFQSYSQLHESNLGIILSSFFGPHFIKKIYKKINIFIGLRPDKIFRNKWVDCLFILDQVGQNSMLSLFLSNIFLTIDISTNFG